MTTTIYEGKLKPAAFDMYDIGSLDEVPDSEDVTIAEYVQVLAGNGFTVEETDEPRGKTYLPRWLTGDLTLWFGRVTDREDEDDPFTVLVLRERDGH